MAHSKKLILALLLLIGAILFALSFGRYQVNLLTCLGGIEQLCLGLPVEPSVQRDLSLLIDIRLPRVLASVFVGASLAVSGAVFQNIFQNPLVSPGILGVQHGAAFGAAFGIVFFSSFAWTQALSFAGALAGVGLSLFFTLLYPRNRFLALVIGGIVSSSFFSALTSIMQYIADPEQQLPEIVYWLMGTLSRIEPSKLLWTSPFMLLGIIFLCLNGKTVNALAMGEEEAKTLGIETKRAWLSLIAATTLISGLTVVLAGIVNWVGLVVPHIMRFFIGPDNRIGLPATAIAGGFFVLFTDTVVRSVWTVEVPLGIATSLISFPLFTFSLWKGWRHHR